MVGPSARRYPYRSIFLIILFLIGLFVLGAAGGRAERSPMPLSTPITTPQHQPSTQVGAGDGVAHPATTAAFCLPTDLTCLLNPTWSIGVVDAAVAIFIVIAGYNLMIARQIGASYQGIMEFLPRIALAVLAANLSLFFIRFFIDLENVLCQGVTDLFGLTLLTNTIVGIFHGNLAGAGLLVFLLAMILGVMNLLLAGQMLLRLVLLVLLIVLAPPAFLCWALPQTQGYARLWTSTFAATVFVQFFQVTALALGAMLISYISAAHLLSLDSTVLTLLVSLAVLYLVLRIPGMLRVYALRPIAEAGPAAVRAAQGAAEYVAGTAVRLVALA